MDAARKDTEMTCTLCGAMFSPDENTCGGCVLHKECKVICCPNCGFGMPKESRFVSWLREHVGKQRGE
jgi:ribosomal protein L37E